MKCFQLFFIMCVFSIILSCDKNSPVSNDDENLLDDALLIVNGGFESGTLEGWTLTGKDSASVMVSDVEARTDSFCVMIDGSAGVQQKVTGLLPGTKYNVVGYVKVGTSTRLKVGVKDFGGEEHSSRLRDTDYFEFKYSFTTGDTSTSAVIFLQNDRETGTLYGDDFSLQRETVPPVDGLTAFAPSGFKWVPIENLSDEFNDGFDTKKWRKNSSGWMGRKPGLFKESQVKVENGNLQITTDLLPAAERTDGWTHAGGLVGSVFPALPSYSGYYECRMKANKTFMSSTFWLINNKSGATGCDNRTTELDIQECIGEITTTAGWAQDFDQRMNSNTHSRNTTCPSTPEGSIGNHATVNGKVWADYHTYGAWWKSPTEIIFYLDGQEVGSVTPAAEFSLNMYLRMVVETYDWNPVPVGGGMNGTEEERTTYYDWVRSYKLVSVE